MAAGPGAGRRGIGTAAACPGSCPGKADRAWGSARHPGFELAVPLLLVSAAVAAAAARRRRRRWAAIDGPRAQSTTPAEANGHGSLSSVQVIAGRRSVA